LVLPDDALNVAHEQGRLHRNFMGYTTQNTDIIIGLGVSAISSVPGAYAQNQKTLNQYYEKVQGGHPPVQKGYFLDARDQRFGQYIRDLSCVGYTFFHPQDWSIINEYCLPALLILRDDGLITFSENNIRVTPTGKSFIRNICSAFDLHMIMKHNDTFKKVFSQAI
jgi:oxygen-independent coproporphyrinogen III oxidase